MQDTPVNARDRQGRMLLGKEPQKRREVSDESKAGLSASEKLLLLV
jgi:hypothetical protein